MKQLKYIIPVVTLLIVFTACNNNDEIPEFPEQPTYEVQTGFAKGADISWVTEMEKADKKFYNSDGEERDCFVLMRELGMNAIRLRVWVDPEDGWCNAQDVLIKAWRAHNLGLRLMIDFHYSDVWADPADQSKPAAWEELNFEELKQAVAGHTTQVLSLLKDNGIDVEWIQIGNETRSGMLFEEGRNPTSSNYAELNNAGYDAAKAVYPDAKMIIHIDRGFDNQTFCWIFDGIKANGGKWDVIGMSLYCDVAAVWEERLQLCYENMIDMVERYNTEVMICEIGIDWDEPEVGKTVIEKMLTYTRAVPNEKGLGVFYWEPQAYGNWNNYSKGAFDESGKPTIALDPFLN
ncbi:MAG: arabinogalactan endo-1,4-beta-galactosidase [Tannerellaceae bacterium]|nr:arabinogalactan endo-1,4-beta-galactosidase [Tannerellaceae bacterium]